MKRADLNETRTVTMSLRALVFLVNCMSRRGGRHPGDNPKNKNAYMEAQDAVLNAFGQPPVVTCAAVRSGYIACATSGSMREAPTVQTRTPGDDG